MTDPRSLRDTRVSIPHLERKPLASANPLMTVSIAAHLDRRPWQVVMARAIARAFTDHPMPDPLREDAETAADIAALAEILDMPSVTMRRALVLALVAPMFDHPEKDKQDQRSFLAPCGTSTSALKLLVDTTAPMRRAPRPGSAVRAAALVKVLSLTSHAADVVATLLTRLRGTGARDGVIVALEDLPDLLEGKIPPQIPEPLLAACCVQAGCPVFMASDDRPSVSLRADALAPARAHTEETLTRTRRKLRLRAPDLVALAESGAGWIDPDDLALARQAFHSSDEVAPYMPAILEAVCPPPAAPEMGAPVRCGDMTLTQTADGPTARRVGALVFQPVCADLAPFIADLAAISETLNPALRYLLMGYLHNIFAGVEKVTSSATHGFAKAAFLPCTSDEADREKDIIATLSSGHPRLWQCHLVIEESHSETAIDSLMARRTDVAAARPDILAELSERRGEIGKPLVDFCIDLERTGLGLDGASVHRRAAPMGGIPSLRIDDVLFQIEHQTMERHLEFISQAGAVGTVWLYESVDFREDREDPGSDSDPAEPPRLSRGPGHGVTRWTLTMLTLD